MRQSTPTSYKELIEEVLISVAKSTYYFQGDADNLQVAVKSVQDEENFPELLKWFPHLKFVYILRNPYAQLNSAINNMRHRRRGVKNKHKVNRDVAKLGRSFPYPYLGIRLKQMTFSYYFMRKFSELEPDHFYVLNYDELLRSPEEQMRKLCEFLEIQFHPNLLEITLGGQPKARMGWSVGQHETNRISTKPLEAWKKQLPPLAIRLVNQYFQDVIEDYGFEYVPSNTFVLKPFSRSEKPLTYVANRMLFMPNIELLMR